MSQGVDVLIIGGGAAGCAAAICAARAGFATLLLEARDVPSVAPGETLHPGVESLFRQLSIWDDVDAAEFHRHRGVWREVAGHRRFSAYGADGAGPWFGFQADRRRLHQILRAAAERAGATIVTNLRPDQALIRDGRVVGVSLGDDAIEAAWTLDATGRRAWLAGVLGLESRRFGRPLRVRFHWRGASPPELDGQPLFKLRPDGWDWLAPLGDGRCASTTLRFSAGGPGHGLDMTWRRQAPAAGPGYFLLGDAGVLLDPSASDGVLRAFLSAILAIDLIDKQRRGVIDQATAAACFNDWLEIGFKRRCAQYHELYGQPIEA